MVGRDLCQQRCSQPVNPLLDLRGRVGILMREHGKQVGQQVEHNSHGTGESHPLGGEAVMEELGERLEDRLALGEVCRALVVPPLAPFPARGAGRSAAPG